MVETSRRGGGEVAPEFIAVGAEHEAEGGDVGGAGPSAEIGGGDDGGWWVVLGWYCSSCRSSVVGVVVVGGDGVYSAIGTSYSFQEIVSSSA